jgi:hypothetical protein
MSDIVSSLEMHGKLITPFMSGVVAASSVIIIQLLRAVANVLSSIEKFYNLGTKVGESMYTNIGFMDFKKIMPPTVMELIAGIYFIECVVIVSMFLSGISRGFNKVHRDYFIFKFLSFSTIFFTLLFFVMVLVFQPLMAYIKV